MRDTAVRVQWFFARQDLLAFWLATFLPGQICPCYNSDEFSALGQVQLTFTGDEMSEVCITLSSSQILAVNNLSNVATQWLWSDLNPRPSDCMARTLLLLLHCQPS